MATVAQISPIDQFKAEARTITKELAELRGKLARTEETIGALRAKRDAIVRDVALGKLRASAVLDLDKEIATAEIPREGLLQLIAPADAKLDGIRQQIQEFQIEAAKRANREKKEARFAELEKRALETSRIVAKKVFEIIAHDLREFDLAREALLREMILPGMSPQGGPSSDREAVELANRARAVIAEARAILFDGPVLRPHRELLRQGWTAPPPDERIILEIVNLRP